MSNKGSTLMEILLSIALVAFVLVAVLTGFTQQQVSTQKNFSKNLAVTLAQGGRTGGLQEATQAEKDNVRPGVYPSGGGSDRAQGRVARGRRSGGRKTSGRAARSGAQGRGTRRAGERPTPHDFRSAYSGTRPRESRGASQDSSGRGRASEGSSGGWRAAQGGRGSERSSQSGRASQGSAGGR